MEGSSSSSKKAGSSSNLSVKKSFPVFPRKPLAYTVFMEECLKKRNRMKESFGAICVKIGDKWNAMTVSQKAEYEAVAKERNLAYEKNLKAYTWQSMTAEEMATYLANLKEPYADSIAKVEAEKEAEAVKNPDKRWGS